MADATTHKVGDTWYRYSEVHYGVANEFDEVVHSYVQLRLSEFKVTKVTPKGAWVSSSGICTPRFVLLSANKRLAVPTKEEALESLIARKGRQIRILEAQTKSARETQLLAQHELAKLKPPVTGLPASMDELGPLILPTLGMVQ